VRPNLPFLPVYFRSLLAAVLTLGLSLTRQAPLAKRIHLRPLTRVLLLWSTLVSPASGAVPGSQTIPDLNLGETELFGAHTPMGRLSYQAGRGLRIGDMGLVLGGFAAAEAELLEGGAGDGGLAEGGSDDESGADAAGEESKDGDRRGALEGLNLFVFFDPAPFAHLFTELEFGPLLELGSGAGAHSNPELDIDRLYLDFGTSDALSVRFGKFLTPVGRRNQISAEPLTWTTSEPLIVEEVFDESATGGMLFGSVFPRGGALSYSLYGQFLNPIDPDRDRRTAEHSAGTRLEWASLNGWTLGASYFASQVEDRVWNHLGGVDLLWQPSARVEVSAETVFGEGSGEEGSLWGVYVEGAMETVRTLYAVGRYERFEPPGSASAIDLFDLGLAWVPAPYLRLKADYLFGDQADDLAEPGLRVSLSILF
jgi:hypothetical protein